MKRLACLLLVVVLVAAMAVPAFAAVERPDLSVPFRDALSAVLAKKNEIAPNYNYYMVFVGNSTGNPSFHFYFTNSPVFSIDSYFYMINYSSLGSVSHSTNLYRVKGFYLSNGTNLAVETVSHGTYLVSYYLENVSTAPIQSLSFMDKLTIYHVPPVQIDKTALITLINELQATKNIGYTPISWTSFQNALQVAVVLLDSQSATQEQIDSAHDDLQFAFNSLVLLPNIESLESILRDAESIKNENYTVASWARFQNALQVARILLAQSSYTQEEVDLVQAELEASIAGLTLDKPPPIVIGGYDVPKSMLNAVSTGDITDIVTDFVRPFLDHAMSAFSVVIPLLGLFLATKLIPKIIRFFLR